MVTLLWTSEFATAKIEYSCEMGSKYFAGDGTYIYIYILYSQINEKKKVMKYYNILLYEFNSFIPPPHIFIFSFKFRCEGSPGEERCECSSGFAGPSCSEKTSPVSFKKHSFIQLALSFSPPPFTTQLRLR